MPELGSRELPDTDTRLEQVETLATEELVRRLENPDEREKLPGTGLLNLVLLFQKQKEPVKEVEDKVEMNVRDLVESTDLPPEVKAELLLKERTRLSEQLAELEAMEVTDE